MTSAANSRSSSRSIHPFPDRSHSPHTATASLRPRNRRLLSTELLQDSEYVSTSKKYQAYRDIDLPESGRALSPLPKPHLSRTENHIDGNTAKGKGIWEGGWSGSWTTLQGIANTVLGSDSSQPTSQSSATVSKGKAKSTAGPSIPDTWGPSGNVPIPKQNKIGAGSLEERDRALRTRKTASVLESHEGINGGLDIAGRFKRRTSVEAVISEDQDEEILVYVHPVDTKDTVTGVILRYNCAPAAFRKANRLWPNDVLQVRKTVLLPVDVCGVKGRPCNGPEFESGIDLLAPTPIVEVPPMTSQQTNERPQSFSIEDGSASAPLDKSERTREDDEAPLWTHVRWVIIDSSANSKPVSISRIRRKDLGYFPPRRRKSTASSVAGTPRASLDVNSYSSSLTSQMSASPRKIETRRQSNLAQTNPYFPSVTAGPSSNGLRSSSTSRTRGDSTTAGDIQRSAWMRGPGGVGTFAKNVRKPGPAQDGLNSWAAKHLPSLAIDYLPSRSIAHNNEATWRIESISEEQRSFGQSGMHSEADDARDQGMGLENAAAAIEGWVRRLATRVPGPPGTPKLGSGKRVSNGPDTVEGVGDLIELLDGSDDGRGFEPSADKSTLIEAFGGPDREDLLGAVRGRSGKSGKGD